MGDFIATTNPLPEFKGKHYWVVFCMYAVTDPGREGERHLDSENFVSLEGPGCFFCEEPWTAETEAGPCVYRYKD